MLRRRDLVDTVIHGISRSGLPALLRRFQPDEFCILMLHGLTTERDHEGIGNSEEIHIHAEDFEGICRLLADHYAVISLDEAVRRIQTHDPLPGGAVVLTFDDGYRSNYDLAYPLLRRYGLHGTIFVATDFVENRAWQWWDRLEYALGHTTCKRMDLRVGQEHFRHSLTTREERRAAFLALLPLIKRLPQEMVRDQLTLLEDHLHTGLDSAAEAPAIYQPATWDQLREMNAGDHIDLGAHTHTHRILGRCREDTVRWELETCRDLLRERAGVVNPLFSYPNGHVGDHTDATRAIVTELGFRCALTTETGFNSVDADPFKLLRFSTGNHPRYVDVTASGAMKVLLAVNDALKMRRKAA